MGPWKQFQALKGWLIDSRVSPLPSDAQGKMEGRKGGRETLFRFSTPNTPLLTLRCVLQRWLWPTQIKRYQVPKLWPCFYFSTQAMTVIIIIKGIKKTNIHYILQKHTIMNSPHDSECIKSLHVLIWLAASDHLP